MCVKRDTTARIFAFSEVSGDSSLLVSLLPLIGDWKQGPVCHHVKFGPRDLGGSPSLYKSLWSLTYVLAKRGRMFSIQKWFPDHVYVSHKTDYYIFSIFL